MRHLTLAELPALQARRPSSHQSSNITGEIAARILQSNLVSIASTLYISAPRSEHN